VLTIRISKQAQKFLLKLPSKHAKQIKMKIESLLQNLNPQDSIQLVDYFPYLRADQGEYRIIYKTENNTLFIVLIGKRNDDEVYRKMRQILK
jgi:mRNA interferase RelE/StbE